jgi:uncharacterized protein (TIGR02186 family)
MQVLRNMAFLAWMVMASHPAAAAGDLVADLSNHLVAITTGFTGTKVLLFGATRGAGDVVVMVRGPRHRQLVRRKDRIAGIWINNAEMAFQGVPAFYSVASSRPLADLVPPAVAARHQIGIENVRLTAPEHADADEAAIFRDALVRNKQRAELYDKTPGTIAFLGNRLFRTDLYFPSNAPVGTYEVQVLLFRGGEVVSASITPLIVSRIGFEAGVFDFAHRHALAYGVLAVLIAVMAGWLAGIIFRNA